MFTEIGRIEKLTDEWNTITFSVIDFEEIDLARLQSLFKETYIVLDKFSKDELVPKQISNLLLEMHDFSWWVSDLEDTPLHEFYQGIVSLVNALNRYFLIGNYDVKALEKAIEEITEWSIKSTEISCE